MVNTTYSEQKWKDAATAAKAVITAAENSSEVRIALYRNDENGDGTFNPYKSVRNVHLEKWNCEVLWAVTKCDANGFEKPCLPSSRRLERHGHLHNVWLMPFTWLMDIQLTMRKADM